MPPRPQTPIAIVGVSALFPGSTDVRGFWADILAGTDLVTEVPPSHWLLSDYYDPDPAAPDKTYCRRGAFLRPVDFDPLEFGVPPSIVPATDTAQLLALIVAQQVLQDAAQGQFAAMDRERISVLLGVTSAQELLGSMVSRLQRPVWIKALREGGIPEGEAQAICDRIAAHYVPWQESSFPGLLGNVVAGRIANRFDLRGTNAVTDAACASSLAALSMGVHELELGEADLVIAGGVDTMNDIFMYLCFSKTPALSPTGDCRPFSDRADGTLLGEGLAMFALKRLSDAERDGDRVYAVLRGIGSSSDGRSKSVYAPLPEGQARALRRAYAGAGYGPETVELVEAHGTGTKAGDAAEFEGLRSVFREARGEGGPWCALGSVKSQIGHTKAAAGAAGLLKAVLALQHKVLPPTIKIDRPNPKLEIEKSPFYLNTERRPWIRDASHPRRAAVSSFGFGGSNFHVTLEEYAPRGAAKAARRLRASPSELVLLCGPTAAALAERLEALLGGELRGELKGDALPDLARSTQLAFDAQSPARAAVVAASVGELRERLGQLRAHLAASPARDLQAPGLGYGAGPAAPGPIAWLFPGQGSQYVGMGRDVAIAFDEARAVWDRAAAARFEGERVSDRVFPPPAFSDEERAAQAQRLTATEWAQPALGLHGAGLARILAQLGLRPDCVAGHSFGEVTALHVAGALDEATLLAVARRRGELMRAAAGRVAGAMSAVSGAPSEVRAVIDRAGAGVVIANHNAPTQVVISGSLPGIERAEAELAARGLTCRRLPVATAFHSPLVSESRGAFLDYLRTAKLAPPAIDVYGTSDAAVYPADLGALRERLAAQLAEPVLFVAQIEAMLARGVRTFVEVGAGSVLTDLVGRIAGDRPHQAIALDRKGRDGVTSLNEALGRLSVAGVPLRFEALWAPFAPPPERPKKKPKPAMTLPISGINSGKPYPPPGGAEALPPPNLLPQRAVPMEHRATHAAAAAASTATPPASAAPPSPPQHAAPYTASGAALSAPASAALSAAPPAAMRHPAPALRGDAQAAWIHAFQETQRLTAEAHAVYQRAMAESHMAFLRTAETSIAGLAAIVTGQPLQMAMPVAHALPPLSSAAAAPLLSDLVLPAAPAPWPTAPAADPWPAAAPVALAPASALGAAPVSLPPIASPALGAAPLASAPVAAVHALPVTPVAAPAAPRAPAADLDLEKLLLSIVAEKTGYPVEMLASTMELESDLGIDSIKRVEILSAMRERAPGLPEVKASELAALRTLGQIVERMRAEAAQGAPQGEVDGGKKKALSPGGSRPA